MDAQMKKGVLEMCILFRLKEDKLYGYELMKTVRERFPMYMKAQYILSSAGLILKDILK